MDLWDGKHGNLSQAWELFFYLIKLVSQFLCAIDPSNGFAAVPESTTNIYCIHCMWKLHFSLGLFNNHISYISIYKYIDIYIYICSFRRLQTFVWNVWSLLKLNCCSEPKARGVPSLRFCMSFVSCLNLIPLLLCLLEHLPQSLLYVGGAGKPTTPTLPALTETRKLFLQALARVCLLLPHAVGSVRDVVVECLQPPQTSAWIVFVDWVAASSAFLCLSLSKLPSLLWELSPKDFFFSGERLWHGISDRELFINRFNHLRELFLSVLQFLHKQPGHLLSFHGSPTFSVFSFWNIVSLFNCLLCFSSSFFFPTLFYSLPFLPPSFVTESFAIADKMY